MIKSKTLTLFIFISLLIICGRQTVYAQRSDTLYYNASWQICEKPFAAYYRFGQIKIDSFWYYTGRVFDYYINDTLAMDGSYSSSGEKEGMFWFFFKDGKPKAKGQYAGNRRTGIWEYYYPNGGLQLRIEYDPGEADFSILDYTDSTGKQLTKDSSGTFEIPVSNEFGNYVYRLEGECKNGNPVGTWKYYSYVFSTKKDMVAMKEVYEKGEFKKGTSYSVTGYSESYKQRRVLRAMPEYPQLRITESFAKDRTSFRNIENDLDLLEYLQNRTAPAYELDTASYKNAMMGILNTLNTGLITKYFSRPDQLYSGEIVFTLTDSGKIKDADVYGNLNDKEKEQMIFFMRKFKKIQEITDEEVDMNKEYKIYFFSLVVADFVPNRYLSYFPEKLFVFSPWPYRALIDRLKAKRKKTSNKH